MTKEKRIALLGGGGHASDLLGVIEASPNAGFSLLGVFDRFADARRFKGRGIALFGHIEDEIDRIDRTDLTYISAVGGPAGRLQVAARADALGLQPADPLINPSGVYLGTGTRVGRGSVIFAGSSVAVGVTIGAHCYLSYNVVIGHDSVLGDGVNVLPGAAVSGGVTIGKAVMLGAGCVVIQGLNIGDGAQVGAGAVVTRDVPPGMTVVGVPARPLQAARAGSASGSPG